MNDTAITQQISFAIYQCIVSVLQQQPDFLLGKYRKLLWEKVEIKTAFINSVGTELNKAVDRRSLQLKVEQYLKQFFAPEFFSSASCNILNQQVHHLIYDRPFAVESLSSIVRQPQNIAVLLLDAENMLLKLEEEQRVQKFCNYPIQIKIAFANWRSGHTVRKDLELHKRGYQMIHVPGGKNSADMKMTAIGSSIFIYYPTAKEVCVCSADGDLTHLCNSLQAHGLSVYSVQKQSEKLIITNRETGETQVHSSEVTIELPTLEETIAFLKVLIEEEQKLTASQWVKLSQVALRFKTKHRLTLNQIAAAQTPSLQVEDIFANHPAEFVMHQLANEIYVSLFSSGVTYSLSSANSDTDKTDASSNGSTPRNTITSSADLEQVLIAILAKLTIASPTSYVSISALQNGFQQLYGYSVKQALQDINLNWRYLTFLKACDAFDLRQTDKEWQVALQKRQVG